MLGIIFLCEGQNSAFHINGSVHIFPEVAVMLSVLYKKAVLYLWDQNPWKMPGTVYIF